VRVIDTTEDANATGLVAIAAVPIPCALAPMLSPTQIGSSTDRLFSNVSPILAPTIPVKTTKNTVIDLSAPVRTAPACAKGDVMHLVRGDKERLVGLNLARRDNSAELNKPNIEEKPVVRRNKGALCLRTCLY